MDMVAVESCYEMKKTFDNEQMKDLVEMSYETNWHNRPYLNVLQWVAVDKDEYVAQPLQSWYLWKMVYGEDCLTRSDVWQDYPSCEESDTSNKIAKE